MSAQSDLPHIMILGIGCVLLRDEGFGVKVVHEMDRRYTFPDHVELMDGGVLGVNLLGFISQADRLIVVDAIHNKGNPGDLYRLTGDDVPERIRAKNSLHQVDFLEALTLCNALDKVPETIIIGVEPEDIDTCSLELTPAVRDQFEAVIQMVLTELESWGITYHRKKGVSTHVPGDTIPGCRN